AAVDRVGGDRERDGEGELLVRLAGVPGGDAAAAGDTARVGDGDARCAAEGGVVLLGGVGARAEDAPGPGVESVGEVAQRLLEEVRGGPDDDGGLFEAVGEILGRAGQGDAVAAGPKGEGELAGVYGGAIDVLAGEEELGAAGGVGPFESLGHAGVLLR